MYVLCVQAEICSQTCAESCDQSCSTGLKISKWSAGDLANAAFCVRIKLMFEWRKGVGKEELSASLPLSGMNSY